MLDRHAHRVISGPTPGGQLFWGSPNGGNGVSHHHQESQLHSDPPSLLAGSGTAERWAARPLHLSLAAAPSQAAYRVSEIFQLGPIRSILRE